MNPEVVHHVLGDEGPLVREHMVHCASIRHKERRPSSGGRDTRWDGVCRALGEKEMDHIGEGNCAGMGDRAGWLGGDRGGGW